MLCEIVELLGLEIGSRIVKYIEFKVKMKLR